MEENQLLLIGGGQMGRALVGGMIAQQQLDEDSITVVDLDQDCRTWWKTEFPGTHVYHEATAEICSRAAVVLLAVKPHAIGAVASEIANKTGSPKLMISVAAGVTLAELAEAAGHQRVIRVMPNTPSLVGAGVSAYCHAGSASDADCQWAESALSAVGLVVHVLEHQIDAVTGLSGSGPAYLCLAIEALADGGVLVGLPRPLALQLASQTVLGTGKLVLETGKHPGQLKDAVASPGGTTIVALHELEKAGFRAALINAVKASAEKSKEMSNS